MWWWVKLIEPSDYGYGFDAQTDEYGDLMKLGTEATVTELPKKETPMLPHGGGMDY